MPTFFVNTDDARISNAFLATLGAAPGSTYLAQIKAFGLVNSVNAMIAATGKTTAADLATTITGNLGLTGAAATAGQAYLTSVTLAGASSTWAANLISTLDLFTTLQNDATYGTAASAYVARINSAVAYSAVAANNSTDLTTLAAAVGSAGSTGAGSTFTLTTGIDFIPGGSGNDTILGDITGGGGTVSSADQVNGGTGTDLIKIYSSGTTVLPDLTKVEGIYIKDTNGMDNLNIATLTDVTSLEFDSTATAAGNGVASVITVASGQSLTLRAVTDGSAGTDGASGDLAIASASTVTAHTIDLRKVGSSTADVDLEIEGSGIATLNLNSTSDKATTDKNYATFTLDGTALKTLNVTGDKLLDMSGGALATLTTIDASKMTAGGVKVSVSGSTLDVTFTGGAGNDVLNVGGDLDVNDNIDGGAGDDTVVTSAATLTSSTNNDVKGFNDTTNVEIAASSATSTITIDASVFTKQNSFSNTDAVTGTAATAVASGSGAARDAALDGVNFTFETGDVFVVGASITGGSSGANAQAASGASEDETNGADALEVVAKVNSGSDTITVRFAAGAAVTLLGGSGEDTASGASGGEAGGDGLNASTVETINIVTASADDDVKFSGGSAGGSGGTGDSISVGANATINISGAGDVNLGTVATQGTAVDDITVNGSDMTGKLTVVTGAGNDIIKGGSKGDDINAGAGTNNLTGGAGADTFKVAAADSTAITARSVITDFAAGAGNDVLDETGGARTYDALTAAQAADVADDADLATAVVTALTATSNNNWTAFSYSSKTYALYKAADNTFDAGADIIIELTGVSVASLDATNFA